MKKVIIMLMLLVPLPCMAFQLDKQRIDLSKWTFEDECTIKEECRKIPKSSYDSIEWTEVCTTIHNCFMMPKSVYKDYKCATKEQILANLEDCNRAQYIYSRNYPRDKSTKIGDMCSGDWSCQLGQRCGDRQYARYGMCEADDRDIDVVKKEYRERVQKYKFVGTWMKRPDGTDIKFEDWMDDSE